MSAKEVGAPLSDRSRVRRSRRIARVLIILIALLLSILIVLFCFSSGAVSR